MTKIIDILTGKSTPEIANALQVLKKELNTDSGYREAWKANIAMPFKDYYAAWKKNNPGKTPNSDEVHEIANKAADYFLDILTDNI
jgi:hypothetical protein